MKLYSVSVAPISGVPVKSHEVDVALSAHGDWIRFNPWQWFLFSESNKKAITDAVSSRIMPNDQVIVAALRPEYAQGIAPQWIWDWMNDRMQRTLSSP
jgi:hypothetical protein